MITSINKGTIEERVIFSEFLQENIPIMIYLPYNYSTLYTYPVLYVQDGQDYFSLGKLPSLLNQYINEERMEKCIVVAVPVQSKRKRLVLYRPKGSQHEAYKRFFAEELVSYIDLQFSTHPVSGARAIMGESLGGTISLEIALQYPHTFHYVITQSGAFYEGTLDRIKQYNHSPDLLHIYQSIGTEETKVETSIGEVDFLALNRTCKEIIEQKGIPLHYQEYKGYHNWDLWQKDLPNILTFLWGKS